MNTTILYTAWKWFVVIFYPRKLYKWFYILIQTLPRDIRRFVAILKIHMEITRYRKNNCTVATLFSQQVQKHPNKVAFYYNEEAWTFKMVENLVNKITNYFEQEGYQKGDAIALLLENCAQYSAVWLGLSKNGNLTALINVNLVKESLLHSIKTAGCKAIIFGTSHVNAIHEIADKLGNMKLYQLRIHPDEKHYKSLGSVDLIEELENISNKIDKPKSQSLDDCLMYIYTSGTTGLPKAAVVTHLKYIVVVKSFEKILGLTENEVTYTPLPLYHGAGVIVGIGQAFLLGSTVVIRKKFSASNYFKDCAKYNVTVGQYIGELCRYLLAVPKDQDTKYQVKTFIGNGLKPQIWSQFVERFKVQYVAEFYGLTEGNIFLVNTDGTKGAVGFIPMCLQPLSGFATIKMDAATGKPIRNKDGFCIRCGVGEPGGMISKLDKNLTMLQYDGYTDKEASEEKVLQNVFCKGDMYMNSGDILMYDELNYYYFLDRLGDTFRWKGENVATSEVEAIISNIVNLNDVSVYGVQIPFSEGKAGMAAILDKNKTLNIDSLAHRFEQNLPIYAIPIFLRLMDSVPLTGNYKLKKNELREEAFNIYKIKDDLYFYDLKFRKYVPLTKEIYNQIENGTVRI